jgi:group I intron endonuclease
MNSGIYKIVNTANGKQYVGSAVDLDNRKCVHWHNLQQNVHHNPHLQAAWNKYGAEAFEFRIVGKCPIERLIELEQEVMDHLKPEYNIALVAGSTIGVKYTEEAKYKLREAWKTRSPVTEDTRRKMSRAQRGNTYRLGSRASEETRRKMSLTRKGKPKSEEHKRKLSEAHRGKLHTEETKRKMKESWKKRRTPEKSNA